MAFFSANKSIPHTESLIPAAAACTTDCSDSFNHNSSPVNTVGLPAFVKNGSKKLAKNKSSGSFFSRNKSNRTNSRTISESFQHTFDAEHIDSLTNASKMQANASKSFDDNLQAESSSYKLPKSKIKKKMFSISQASNGKKNGGSATATAASKETP